jgi:hypothetical protein
MRFRRGSRPTSACLWPVRALTRPKARVSAACRPRCCRGSTRKPTPTCRTATCAPLDFVAPGIPIPSVVGPFSNYDFRVYAQQNIVDLESYRGLKASERALDAGKMDLQDARDLIVRSIASLYLNAQSAAARVESAQSRVTDSSTLSSWPRTSTTRGRRRALMCCAPRCSWPTTGRQSWWPRTS